MKTGIQHRKTEEITGCDNPVPVRTATGRKADYNAGRLEINRLLKVGGRRFRFANRWKPSTSAIPTATAIKTQYPMMFTSWPLCGLARRRTFATRGISTLTPDVAP
jgi:hypothetical protein